MSVPKLAIINPRLIPGGGSEAKPLWMIQALKNDYEVYLITMGEVNLDILNETYGTKIKHDEIKIISFPIPFFFRMWFDALRGYRLARFCKRNSSQFDLMISTYNMMDFGRGGIQCIADFSFDDGLRRALHLSTRGRRDFLYRDSPFRKAYLKIGEILSGNSRDGWKRNLTIVNSNWSGELIKEIYGVESIIIYPPVLGEFPEIPWYKRENGFVCLARLVPEKQVEKTVEILEKVRRKGWDIHLHILGRTDNLGYVKRLNQLCKDRSEWVYMEGLLTGQRKLEFIAKHKFGISGCKGEAFGIAVAEMVKAGCIPWVPNSGGQVEILNHPSLVYDDVDDAVSKIEMVLKSNEMQEKHREYLAKQGEKFSSERFESEIRKVVESFLKENAEIQQ